MIDRTQNPSFLNSFLDYTLTYLNKSPNTVREYNYDLTMFLRFLKIHFNKTSEKDFAKIEISDITINFLKKVTINDIRSFLAYLTNSCNSKPATRSRKSSSIRVFFNYLTQEKLIDKNPAQTLKNPKQEKRLPKYLTLEDSEKLLQITANETENAERDYAIITLFLNCGFRLSELVGINIKNINFDDCKLNVIGKGNKERTIYLNKACMNAIDNYLNVRPSNQIKEDKKDSKNALFLSKRNERISKRTVQYIVKRELRTAGLDTKKYSTHKLRHTAATLMYQYGGVDIRALQELLGHESISTTEIYTHVNNEQVRDAVDKNPLSQIEGKKKR